MLDSVKQAVQNTLNHAQQWVTGHQRYTLATVSQAVYTSVLNLWRSTQQAWNSQTDAVNLATPIEAVTIPTETKASATLSQTFMGQLMFTMQLSPTQALTRTFQSEQQLLKFLDQHQVSIWQVSDLWHNQQYYWYASWGEWNKYTSLTALYRDIATGTEAGVFGITSLSDNDSSWLIPRWGKGYQRADYASACAAVHRLQLSKQRQAKAVAVGVVAAAALPLVEVGLTQLKPFSISLPSVDMHTYSRLAVLSAICLTSHAAQAKRHDSVLRNSMLLSSMLPSLSLWSLLPAAHAQTPSFAASLELSSLNGTNGFAINGAASQDWSGFSVSSAGDVNGDGLSDILVGAYPTSPGGRTQAGSSYVVFGERTFTSPLELSNLNGTNGFVINGVASNDYSGYSLSSAGDMNNDGFADIVIGAYLASPGGRTYAGSSYVVFGKTTFTSPLELASLNGINGFVINGVANNDRSGWSVSSAGDINNDGFTDIVIGAYWADPGGRTDAGSSYVVLGQASFTSPLELSSLNGTNGFIINGVASGDYSGRSVSSAGDINNDGFADIVIGASTADPGGRSAAGSSYVVFGRPTFTSPLELASLNGINGFVINGVASGDYSGYSVSSAGDINNDGFADIVIGAWGADPGGRAGAGSSYVVFGKPSFTSPLELSSLNGINGSVINGVASYDQSGASVSSAGDINNDGFADIVIGAYGASPGNRTQAGSSYVVFGNDTFTSPLELSSLNGTNGFVINGVANSDSSGYSVSSAGDINNDGFADIVIGAYQAAPGNKTLAGSSYVVFGQRSVLPTTFAATLTTQQGITPTTAQLSSLAASTVADQSTTANPFSSSTNAARMTTRQLPTVTRSATATGSATISTGNLLTLNTPSTGGQPSATAINSVALSTTGELTDDSSTSPAMNLGLLIGATAGGIACVALSIGGIVILLKRRQKKALDQDTHVELANRSVLATDNSDNPNAALYAMYANFKHSLSTDIYNASAGQLILGHKYAVYLTIDRSTADELRQAKGIEVNFSKGIYETAYSLGAGQFGRLLVGRHRDTGEFVAIKSVVGEQQVIKSRSEAKLQSLVSGKPNIMPLLDSVEVSTPEGTCLFQVMPIASFGNGDYLATELSFVDAKLKEALTVHVANSLATGLQHLHQAHLYHLDVKPANFVVDQEGGVYLIDFGCAKHVKGKEGSITGGTGDSCYYSPDRLAHTRSNMSELETDEIKPNFSGAKADAWALGITLLELITRDNPFAQGDVWQRLRRWDTAYFAKVLATLPELRQPQEDSIWAVIKGLLDVNPDQRLTMRQVLAMPVFKRSDLVLSKAKLTDAITTMKETEVNSRKGVAVKSQFTYIPKAKNSNYHDSAKTASAIIAEAYA